MPQKTTVQIALERLGLGENEAQLYSILLKHPASSIQDLQKHSPFPRTMLYYILRKLAQLNLVRLVEKPRRSTYFAEDPRKLYELLLEREHQFEKDKQHIEQLIPELRNQYRLSQQRPGVRFFEGIEGYRAAFQEMLAGRPSLICSYNPIPHQKKPGLEIREDVRKQRTSARIVEHILLLDTAEGRDWARKQPDDALTIYRFLPSQLAAFNMDIHLADSKVIQTNYEDREPSMLVIESRGFYDMQQAIFTLLWNKAVDHSPL